VKVTFPNGITAETSSPDEVSVLLHFLGLTAYALPVALSASPEADPVHARIDDVAELRRENASLSAYCDTLQTWAAAVTTVNRQNLRNQNHNTLELITSGSVCLRTSPPEAKRMYGAARTWAKPKGWRL
jgi:hypothetical protein